MTKLYWKLAKYGHCIMTTERCLSFLKGGWLHSIGHYFLMTTRNIIFFFQKFNRLFKCHPQIEFSFGNCTHDIYLVTDTYMDKASVFSFEVFIISIAAVVTVWLIHT